MSAFLAATAAIMADPNMGVAASWKATPSSQAQALRVVRTRPDEALATFRASSIVPSDVLLVALADLAQVPADGTFTIGAEVLTVLSAQRDVVHAAWRVECRR